MRSEAGPKRSPPHPDLSSQGPQPNPSPRGTCTELQSSKKADQTAAPSPPPHDNQRTRHRALLTRIFPRHGAALNGRGQRSKWREGRNRVGHQAHISSATPGGLLQRPRRPGQPPQWADIGDHDGRRAPRTKRAGKSHQPAVSPGWMRSESGPKKKMRMK